MSLVWRHLGLSVSLMWPHSFAFACFCTFLFSTFSCPLTAIISHYYYETHTNRIYLVFWYWCWLCLSLAPWTVQMSNWCMFYSSMCWGPSNGRVSKPSQTGGEFARIKDNLHEFKINDFRHLEILDKENFEMPKIVIKRKAHSSQSTWMSSISSSSSS